MSEPSSRLSRYIWLLLASCAAIAVGFTVACFVPSLDAATEGKAPVVAVLFWLLTGLLEASRRRVHRWRTSVPSVGDTIALVAAAIDAQLDGQKALTVHRSTGMALGMALTYAGLPFIGLAGCVALRPSEPGFAPHLPLVLRLTVLCVIAVIATLGAFVVAKRRRLTLTRTHLTVRTWSGESTISLDTARPEVQQYQRYGVLLDMVLVFRDARDRERRIGGRLDLRRPYQPQANATELDLLCWLLRYYGNIDKNA